MDPNIQQSQQPLPQQPIAPQPISKEILDSELPHSSSLPKMFLSILGALVVLGLIGGAYYLGTQKNAMVTSNQKPTSVTPTEPITSVPTAMPTSPIPANWKIFTNTNLGYSFQFPVEWYLYPIQKTTSLDLQTISPVSYATRDTDGVPNGDYIDVFVENANNLSIQDWAKKQLQIPIKLTPQTTNGIIWERTSDYPFYIGGEAAFTKQGDKIFNVAWTKNKGDISVDTFEKILSSFKFTN